MKSELVLQKAGRARTRQAATCCRWFLTLPPWSWEGLLLRLSQLSSRTANLRIYSICPLVSILLFLLLLALSLPVHFSLFNFCSPSLVPLWPLKPDLMLSSPETLGASGEALSFCSSSFCHRHRGHLLRFRLGNHVILKFVLHSYLNVWLIFVQSVYLYSLHYR